MSENTATTSPSAATPATTATAGLSPTSPSPSALSLATDLSLTTERLLMRPDRLERLCKKHLKSLKGNLRADLIVELLEWTLDRGESAAFSAGIIKRIVEGLTTKEVQEMGVERATLEERVGLKDGLIPLAEFDTGVSRRCQNSFLRLDEAWGEDW